MRPRLKIRLAREDDARAIGVLVRRCTRQDVFPDQTARARAHLMAMMTARAERERIAAGKRYHVAEIGGRLAGVVATRDDSHIFRLFVSRRFRHRGVARALLQRAIADCLRRARTGRFTLNASKFAIPAYRRLGFVAAGRLVARGPGRVIAAPMVLKAAGPAGVGASAGGRKRHN